MSLVDYDSSDEDESEVKDEVEEREDLKTLKAKPDIAKVHAPPPPPESQRFSSTAKQSNPQLSVVKLPDASMLLNSLDSPSYPANYSDHSTWVAAAVSRKRDASGFGSSSSSMLGKLPKATPVHSKSIPDTIRGQLVPPQLKGRSNIVTEDIGKLFVKKKVESSTQSISDK